MERFRAFYEMYLGSLPDVDGNGDVQVRSCFRRNDSNPSMFVNLETGKYNDFGSDFKGDAYNFYMAHHGATFKAAKKAVDEIVGGDSFSIKVPVPIPSELVETWHNNLLKNYNVLKYVTEERGISLEVVKQLKLGYDGDRFTFPIYSKWGYCVNVRRYLPGSSDGDKMINFKEGYGTARLFPIENLKKNIVFISEGEWDMGVLNSNGFNAVTQTAGAGTWKQEWIDEFKDKDVYVVYDNDEAGKLGATKVASALFGVAKNVYIVILPVEGTKSDKDVTDYFVKHHATPEEFLEFVQAIEPWKPSAKEEKDTRPIHQIALAEARNSKYKGKIVQFDVMVVGKDTAPYNIPQKFTAKCSTVGVSEKMCATCQIGRCGGEKEVHFPASPSTLEMIRLTHAQQQTMIKKRIGVPNGCTSFQIEDEDSTNVEELIVAPNIDEYSSWSGESMKYLLQSVFVVGDGVDANKSYRMRGIMTPDPWQQHVTFVLTHSEPLQDSISTFRMTPELKATLGIFQTEDVEAKFREIHFDFETNITHILGRDDVLIGLDLVYHSVLSFNFMGAEVQRGWTEMLCIGDTRTGKSETAQKLLQHYRLGEMSTAENTSYAGLIGGLQQSGDRRWMLTWGKLPLNDGRLFMIDEASGLSIDDISKMSSIRSSGIAEVTKIQTERTHSRTRLVWLSNPRSGRSLSAYSYGVQTVPELIGKSEDIARFDFVVSAARNEVDTDMINSLYMSTQHCEHTYTSDLCRQLILWAWSRTPEQVVFEDTAVTKILELARRQGKEYTPSIPLIEGANHRIKLARIAVAVAARVFSCDETGEKIIVKEEHVQYGADFLERIYSKPSFDYKRYSERELKDISVANEKQDDVIEYLTLYPDVANLFDSQEYVWPKHFEEQLGLSKDSTQEHVAFFIRNRMIKDFQNRGYRKTPAFIALLREWKINHEKED